MDEFAVIQSYQHEVYSAKIGHFDIEIDIETGMYDGRWCSIDVKSTIGEVCFYTEEYEAIMSHEDAYNHFMSEAGIQRIIDLSNERLNEIKQLIKE